MIAIRTVLETYLFTKEICWVVYWINISDNIVWYGIYSQLHVRTPIRQNDEDGIKQFMTTRHLLDFTDYYKWKKKNS